MNYVVISGQIVGDIKEELNRELYCCKFKLKNTKFSEKKSNVETVYIDCICYGNVATFVNTELYDGANVVVTGRVLTRHYIVNGTGFYKLYIGCNTVTKLEQEDYR